MNNRYMIVKYVQKPNGKWDEVTEFRKNLKLIHYQTAKVILDFKSKKCIVNQLNKEADFETMLEFYKRLLGDRLTPHLPEGL
jgi:adenylate kinase family enzyme